MRSSSLNKCFGKLNLNIWHHSLLHNILDARMSFFQGYINCYNSVICKDIILKISEYLNKCHPTLNMQKYFQKKLGRFFKNHPKIVFWNIFAYLGPGGTYLNILKFSKWYLYKWLSYSSEHNLEKRTFGHPKCCVIVNGAIYLSGYNRVMRKLTKF